MRKALGIAPGMPASKTRRRKTAPQRRAFSEIKCLYIVIDLGFEAAMLWPVSTHLDCFAKKKKQGEEGLGKSTVCMSCSMLHDCCAACVNVLKSQTSNAAGNFMASATILLATSVSNSAACSCSQALHILNQVPVCLANPVENSSKTKQGNQTIKK